MDDSHEVIINTTPSRDIEGDPISPLKPNLLREILEG
jgi:hypothetical protein